MSPAIKDSENEHEAYLRILSLSSLFQGNFNIDWLQDLSKGKASLILAALNFGVKKKWLTSRDAGIFCFIDPSRQNRLLNSLSSDEQKSMHQRVADLLIEEASTDPNIVNAVVPHLLHISNDMPGCQLLLSHGNIYRIKHRYTEASRYYDKAIEDLGNLKSEEAERLFISVALRYLRMLTEELASDRVIAFQKKAIELAEKYDEKKSLSMLYMHLARSEALRSRYRKAIKLFHRGMELAETLSDHKFKRTTAIFGQFFHYWLGRFKEVIRSYEALAPDVDEFPTELSQVSAVLLAGGAYAVVGQVSQGLGLVDAMRAQCHKLQDFYMESTAGICMGQILMASNHIEEARPYLEESVKTAFENGHLYAYGVGLVQLSHLYYMTGEKEKSRDHLQKAIKLKNQSQIFFTQCASSFFATCWAMETGEFPAIADFSFAQEIDSAIESENIFMKGLALRYKALLLNRQGAPAPDIIVVLRRSIHYLQDSGHIIELAASFIEMARTHLRIGHPEKAQQYAAKAAKISSALHISLIPADIHALLGSHGHGENLLDEILRLGQELVMITDNRDLPRRIISTVNRITGAERGAIFYPSKEGHQGMILRAAKNLTAGDVTMPAFAESLQLIEEAYKTGQGKIKDNDVEGFPYDPDSSPIRSCLCVPMIIRGKVAGVLYHDNRLFHGAFKARDLNILNYFAAQAAIAMDNAQSWETLQNMYEQQQHEKQYYKEQYIENIHFEEFVGKSPAILNVFRKIEKVSGTDATVLIEGETGVGKELVARSLHSGSLRNDHPFIRVNCGALPETLITSELFGHEKGAFTGATSRRIGRFELADKGTLFLDEIGDITPEVQVRLLRVLQSKEFERVGGQETLCSDFRLIAATNRDLRKEVLKGRFRQDLFYRLNIFPIHVPPLRERREDIPLLAQYFLKVYAGKFNKDMQRIAQKDMDIMTAYNWPGNVRELENVMERGVILSAGSIFTLPKWNEETAMASEEAQHLSLKEHEKKYIRNILEKTQGKIRGSGGAAEVLDIHPNTLYSRMKKLGIS